MLSRAGFLVAAFNSRGAGRSGGHAGASATTETADYESVIARLLSYAEHASVQLGTLYICVLSRPNSRACSRVDNRAIRMVHSLHLSFLLSLRVQKPLTSSFLHSCLPLQTSRRFSPRPRRAEFSVNIPHKCTARGLVSSGFSPCMAREMFLPFQRGGIGGFSIM